MELWIKSLHSLVLSFAPQLKCYFALKGGEDEWNWQLRPHSRVSRFDKCFTAEIISLRNVRVSEKLAISFFFHNTIIIPPRWGWGNLQSGVTEHFHPLRKWFSCSWRRYPSSCIYLVRTTPVVANQGLSSVSAWTSCKNTQCRASSCVSSSLCRGEVKQTVPEVTTTECLVVLGWASFDGCVVSPGTASRLRPALWPVTFVYTEPRRGPWSNWCQILGQTKQTNARSASKRETQPRSTNSAKYVARKAK